MPETDNNKWEKQPENKIIDEGEIKKIEDINKTLSAAETAEWHETIKAKINQIDNEFLEDIKKQCNLILSEIKSEWEENQLRDLTEEQSKAILSLLKIKQIQFPWSITAEITIDSKSESVFNTIWTKPDVFKWILPDNVIAYLNKKIAKNEESERNKYKEDIVINKNIYETSNTEESEVDNQNSESDELKRVSPEKAKIYLQSLISEISVDTKVSSKEIVKSNFEKVRKESRKNTLFIPAVDALINKIYPELSGITLSLNPKMYSEKIRKFQNKASNNDTYKEILKQWWLKNDWVDGVLWYNTLKAILDINQLEDWFKPAENEVKVDNKVENRDKIWERVEEAPLSVFNLQDLGTFWPDNEFIIKDSLIQKEWDSEFINIWWDRYFIKWWSDADYKINQLRTKYIWFDENWVQREMYKNVLTFWKIEKWKFVEWNQITVDWNGNQIKMSKLDAKKIRIEWNEKVEWSIWVVNVWNKFDNGKFNWKWRIVLFQDGKDTKRLEEKQLDSFDYEDFSRILDLAVDVYSSTWHKPSSIWQDNMNDIVYYIMKKSGWLWLGYLDAENARVKRISHMILWLNSGFYTNPSKKLEEDDLNEYTDDVILRRLGLSKFPEGYEDLKNKNEVKKGDHIKNRLLILNDFLKEKQSKFKRESV